MLFTHTPKIFNARIKQNAISARIEGSITDAIICSKTTNMRKEFWASPRSAADMKKAREESSNISNDFVLQTYFPELSDPQLKQILLPMDWRNDQYVSITPVASMGIIHELYHRLNEKRLPFFEKVIQPTKAAIANHGEALLMQSGAVRMLRRGPKKQKSSEWKGDFVQITGLCSSMNISSGMVAIGLPAITAIGGFVHYIERKIGKEIEFALGIKSSCWRQGVPRLTINKGNNDSSTGRVNGNSIKVRPGYSADEFLATGEIVLLLKTDAENDLLVNILANTNRIAGGSLFNVKVCSIKNGTPPDASYIIDASSEIEKKQEDIDNLDTALRMYSSSEDWKFCKNGHTLNQTGYALLEKPRRRALSRENYMHAWAEPVFSIINQGAMTDSAWWSRKNREWGVLWQASSYS